MADLILLTKGPVVALAQHALSAKPRDLGALFQIVEVISPPLHHLTALLQIFGSMVCGADFIALRMCELAFYRVSVESALIKNGRGGRSKAVNRRLALIAHAI